MFDNPNPRFPGKYNAKFSAIRSISSGNDIAAVDTTGDGDIQVSYVPKAPAILSVTQDYSDYSTSGGQVAAYSHGKLKLSDNDSVIYTILGNGDTAGQTIDVELDFQNCGSFVTTSTGGFEIQIHVLARNTIFDDYDVYTYFSGCGLKDGQSFTNLRGNQLSLSYSGSKFVDPYFSAGLGTVETSGFNVQYKPAGST